MSERLRTSVLILGTMGMLNPIFFWIALTLALLGLSSAANTTAKKFMIATGLVNVCSAIFFVVFLILGISDWRLVAFFVTSCSLLFTLYVACAVAFLVFFDKTFRQLQGRPENTLANLSYVRGIHIALGTFGIVFVPIATFVEIPLVLSAINRDNESRGLSTSRRTTIAGVIALLLEGGQLLTLVALCVAQTSRCYSDFGYSAYDYCYLHPLFDDYWWLWLSIYMFRLIALVLWMGFADNYLTQRLIDTAPLHAGGSDGTGVVHSTVVKGGNAAQIDQQPCPSCNAPLQYTKSGLATQVQCYQCQSIVEFSG